MSNRSGRRGLTSSGGSNTVITHHNANRGFSPFPLRGMNEVTTTGELLQAGLNAGVTTVSGSAALTTDMPLAVDCLGGTYIIRALSADAHIISSSQETAGTLVFTNGTDHGSRVTLGGAEGDSVVLLSDGLNFIILGSSGSLTIDGT